MKYQQASFRQGRQSENVAQVLLYRCCFISEPVKVSDDIGIDYFCTLFESRRKKGNTDLIPRSSFAIQVKSKPKTLSVDLTRSLPCLTQLELPYFIGIADRKSMTLSIHSGEFLTPLFAYKGQPLSLKAKLCQYSDLVPDYSNWHVETTPGNIELLFPNIATITNNADDETMDQLLLTLQAACSRMLDNIASSLCKEFFFKGSAPGHMLMFAGPESVRYFEANFFNRLAEAFYNLHFAFTRDVAHRPEIRKRFNAYESVLSTLRVEYGDAQLPALLTKIHKEAAETINAEPFN